MAKLPHEHEFESETLRSASDGTSETSGEVIGGLNVCGDKGRRR